MPCCELCGKERPLVSAEVEGVELKVCSECGKLGTIRKQVSVPQPKQIFSQPEMPEFKVVDTIASLLRSAREKRGMSQEEFAKWLQEKESMIPKWESGQLKPDIETAQRMGRKLGVNMVEEEEILSMKPEPQRKGEELTLGDFVKIKKRTGKNF